MTIEELLLWMDQNPKLAFGGVLLLSLVVFFIARSIIARGLYYIAERTKNKFDDVIVNSLRPFRIAWIAPLIVIHHFSYLLPEFDAFIEQAVLFFVLWVAVFTFNSLLNAVNDIYESDENYTGVPIQGYLDLVKLLFLLVGVILSISLITGESPLVLLTGLGALTAVLLLIFRDTMLSFVASIQISINDLVKEGDWIEIPSQSIDGNVVNMTLHTIKIQNWDMTISVIPTYKIMEYSYRNWRGMTESGGRRIKRAVHIDIASIAFVDEDMLARYRRIGLLAGYLDKKEKELEEYNRNLEIDGSVPVNGRRLTNVGTFRAYMEAYVRNHPDLHQAGMTLLVRQLSPGPQGLPIEIYGFTRTTAWEEYEVIQADIFDHLLAAAPHFGLHVFQEPTGYDFSRLATAN